MIGETTRAQSARALSSLSSAAAAHLRHFLVHWHSAKAATRIVIVQHCKIRSLPFPIHTCPRQWQPLKQHLRKFRFLMTIIVHFISIGQRLLQFCFQFYLFCFSLFLQSGNSIAGLLLCSLRSSFLVPSSRILFHANNAKQRDGNRAQCIILIGV